MEIKKSEKASLENKRFLFTEVGFVVALLIVLGAFEYTSKEKKTAVLEADETIVEVEDMVPITQETPPPPEAAPKIPILSDNIDIVDDDIEVDDSMFQNLEDSDDLAVEIMDYVEEVEEEVHVKFGTLVGDIAGYGGDSASFPVDMTAHYVSHLDVVGTESGAYPVEDLSHHSAVEMMIDLRRDGAGGKVGG